MLSLNRFGTILSPMRLVILFCLTFIFGSSVFGGEPEPEFQRLTAQAVVSFAGTSTLHDFGGQLAARPFSLVLSNGTWSATADVVAGQMTTANGRRDHNMHRMLATNDFPLIHGVVTGAPMSSSTGTNVTLRLTIQNQSRDLPVRISDWKESHGEISFHAAWELSLKQFALRPPSLVGVIRVGDRVQLEAQVTARKPISSTSGTATTFP